MVELGMEDGPRVSQDGLGLEFERGLEGFGDTFRDVGTVWGYIWSMCRNGYIICCGIKDRNKPAAR